MATPNPVLEAVTAGLEQVDLLVSDPEVVAMFQRLADLQPVPRDGWAAAAREWEERQRREAEDPAPHVALFWWHSQALCNLPQNADLDFLNPWAHRSRDPDRKAKGRGRPATQLEDCQEVCSACPVREPCKEWADETGQVWGVWGGVPRRPRTRIY